MSLRWQAIQETAALALHRELKAWDMTPFMAGVQVQGTGVDCVGLAGAIMDGVRGLPPTPIRTLRHGAARHAPDAAAEDLFRLLHDFQPLETVRSLLVEPGDLVVTTPGGTKGGPGHLFVVGTQTNVLWTALPPHGVRRCGKIVLAGLRVIRIYRPTDKGTWA